MSQPDGRRALPGGLPAEPARGRQLPPPDVVAAIAAAVEACWPRPSDGAAEPDRATPAWRFSGRWWADPLPLRRRRPVAWVAGEWSS